MLRGQRLAGKGWQGFENFPGFLAPLPGGFLSKRIHEMLPLPLTLIAGQSLMRALARSLWNESSGGRESCI